MQSMYLSSQSQWKSRYFFLWFYRKQFRMATDNATTDTEDSSMPSGIAAVCLLHLGLGALGVLGGLALFVFSPFVGVFAVLLGLILLALGYDLMKFRARGWRRAIAFHAVDIIVGLILLLGDGIKQTIGVVISASIIIYLYSQKNLYLNDSE